MVCPCAWFSNISWRSRLGVISLVLSNCTPDETLYEKKLVCPNEAGTALGNEIAKNYWVVSDVSCDLNWSYGGFWWVQLLRQRRMNWKGIKNYTVPISILSIFSRRHEMSMRFKSSLYLRELDLFPNWSKQMFETKQFFQQQSLDLKSTSYLH